MGTTVQSIAGRGDGHGPSQPLFPERSGQWQQRSQHSIESPEANFSTPIQNGASLFVQAAAQNAGYDTSAAVQRSGSQVPSGSAPGSRQTPGPTGPGGQAGAGGNQANMERRGPVEFNHAISYVNKIKVRSRCGCCQCNAHRNSLTSLLHRTASKTSLRYTNSSLRFSKPTSESRNPSKMCTPK